MARAVGSKVVPVPGGTASRAGRLVAAVAEASVETAQAVAREAASGWWDELASRRGKSLVVAECRVRLPSIAADTTSLARLFGVDLAILPVADAVAEIGKLYTHALPPRHRSANGIFYTPPALVRRLLDQAAAQGMDWRTANVLSPSCGGGAFLVEDARRMAEAMGAADPAIVVASVGKRLAGWDRDPFACWLSQVAVEAVLLDYVAASGTRLPAVTECRDSLVGDWSAHAGKYDLVNENPAFGKVRKSDMLTERFARSQRGHMNMYALFMDLAVHLARPGGGIVAFLTPTSYLAGGYFAKLRDLLAAEAPPASIDLVESRQDVFPDVLQEVALSVFVRGRTEPTATCSCVHVEPSGLRVEEAGELRLPRAAGKPWVVARGRAGVPVVAAMRGMSARLADWGYRVKTGPLVPHKNRSRMHATGGGGRVPVVWAESISSTGGKFAIRCDRVGRKAWYEPKDAKDSNVTGGAALLLQRTTAKEQVRRLIGAVMSAGSVAAAGGRIAVENHVNMVVQTVGVPAVPMSDLAKFFASGAADAAFRCISGSVAVSATELEALPLPDPAVLVQALSSSDPEAALNRLYGIADVQELPAGDDN